VDAQRYVARPHLLRLSPARCFSVNILYTPKLFYVFYISLTCVRADEILEERLQILTLALRNVYPFFITPFRMSDYYTTYTRQFGKNGRGLF
jgi:hypothetical protein